MDEKKAKGVGLPTSSSKEAHSEGSGWLQRFKDLLFGSIFRTMLVAIALLLLLALLTMVNSCSVSGISGALKDFVNDDGKEFVVLAVFPDSTVSEPMLDGLGFEAGQHSQPLTAGVRLEKLYEKNSPEDTRDLLYRRLQDPNVLMVVGHERSSTVRYLNSSLYEALEVPVPLVLPAVTNPEITKTASPERRHILRLPATDDKQVDILRQTLSSIGAEATTILVDIENAAYSNYITRELVARSGARGFINSRGIGIHGLGVDVEAILNDAPDSLVFVGMEIEAALFLQALRRFEEVQTTNESGESLTSGLRLGLPVKGNERHTLAAFFTDGVAGSVFHRAASRVLHDEEVIFLTGPFLPSASKGEVQEFPDYREYASAAKDVVERLIEDTRKQNTLSREAVLSTLQSWQREQKAIDVGRHRFRFSGTGDNLGAKSHVYEVRRANVTHSSRCSCQI